MNRATVAAAGFMLAVVGVVLAVVTDSQALFQAGVACLLLGGGCALAAVLSRPEK